MVDDSPLVGAQPAGAAGQRLPKTAIACCVFSFVQVVGSLIVLYCYGTGGTIDVSHLEEISHFNVARMMLLPAMLLEACHVLSSRSRAPGIKLHGAEMSCCVVVEYLVKMVCYSAMANGGGGIVHLNMRAHGPARGCYTYRYIEWSIAVPTLIVLNNYPLRGKRDMSEMFRRLWPNLLLTWSYVLASWVAQVTPAGQAGWVLVALSFSSYLCSACDQASIVSTADRGLLGYRFKVGAVVVKEVLFLAYGAMYLLGVANVVSPMMEQLFYTTGDILLKVVQASILVVVRNWEGLADLRNALERQVEAGKADMSRLFRRANAPIFTVTPDGVVVAWNDHLAQMSGVAEDLAIGGSIFALATEDSRQCLGAAMDSCANGLSSSAVEVSMPGSAEDGRPVQMLLTLIVQLGDSERRTITAIGQDLTEIAELKATQEKKTRITAVLGHELRSPLHGIMGLSASMLDSAASPVQKRHLGMIKGCAARLLDLVTNIMEMAKTEKLEAAGEARVEKKPVNIVDVVDEVVGMTQLAVDKSGKHLVSRDVVMVNSIGAGEWPSLLGDSYKITQLLYNLVTNAAKFTTSGSITISAREDEEQGALEIDVADTGVGISPQAMVTIFEPFQQEENKDSRSFQGIGLGLAVAKGIAKLHGGGIRVASVVGQGSTFTIRLPCDSSRRQALTSRAAEAMEKSVAPPAPAPPAPVDGGSPLLLSIGDKAAQQAVVQALAGEYRLLQVATAEEARACLAPGGERPVAVLLDVAGGAARLEALSQLRSEGGHSALPIVVLSASAPQEAASCEAFSCGATDYVQKPFSSAVLRHRLRIAAEVQGELRRARAGPPGEGPASAALAARKEDRSQQTEAAPPPAAPEDVEALRREAAALRARLVASEARAAMEPLRREPGVGAEADRWKSPRKCPSPRPSFVSKVALSPGECGSDYDMTGSCTSESTLTACSRCDFYRDELEARNRVIRELTEKARCNKTDAWVANQRADALERSLRHLRQARCLAR